MIQVLKNQAVTFPEVDHNTENEACTGQNLQFCQLVTNGIETQFQIRLTEEDGENKVTNGTFLTDLSGWTASANFVQVAGMARAAVSLGNPQTLFQSLTLKPNTVYKINYQIPFMSPTFASGQGGLKWNLFVFDSTIIGGTSIGTNLDNQTGYYTFYIVTDNSVGARILDILALPLPGLTGTGFLFFDNIEVFELTTPASISLLDCDDNFAASITNLSFFEDLATVVVDWQALNLADDCYKLCITDGSEDLAFDFLSFANMWIWENGSPIIIDTTNPNQSIAINWI